MPRGLLELDPVGRYLVNTVREHLRIRARYSVCRDAARNKLAVHYNVHVPLNLYRDDEDEKRRYNPVNISDPYSYT